MMAQVASWSGISHSQLLRMESGLSGVTSQRLIDLAAIYDVSPSNLLTVSWCMPGLVPTLTGWAW